MWIKQIFNLLPQLKRALLYGVSFALVIEFLKLLPPYFMKVAIDMLVMPDTVLSWVLLVIGGVLVVTVSITLIEDRYFLYMARRVFDIETSILRKGHRKLLELDLRYHEAHPSGELVHLMNKGSNRLADLSWFVFDQFLGATIQIILTCLVLLWVHPGAGLVFSCFMPVVIFLIHRTGKRVQPYRERYHEHFQQAAWEMNQSLLNVRTVKDYVQEDKERKKYEALLDEYLRLADIRMKVENHDVRNRDFVLGICRFLVLFYAVYLVYIGEMTPGTLVLFATLSEKVVSSMFRLGRLYSHLGDSMEAIRQFSQLFKESAEIIDKTEAVPCTKLEGKLTFDHVSFAYENEQYVLQDLSLEVPPRSVVAIVGRSGAGKTTIAKLLMRHYDVQKGRILIDDQDIRNFKVREYRRKIAVVSQHIEIFDASVVSNIAYGTDASMEEVLAASHAAHAHEFVEKLPEGYQTRVGERGVKLSGGQRQRVGIARALIMKPAVLIFDEATSSLDSESERLIQHALYQISKNQTMIIIAHRLSTIVNADMIVVLDDGKIAEVGSYHQLMKREGMFARMRQLQDLGEIRA